jgi:hypothetical protein
VDTGVVEALTHVHPESGLPKGWRRDVEGGALGGPKESAAAGEVSLLVAPCYSCLALELVIPDDTSLHVSQNNKWWQNLPVSCSKTRNITIAQSKTSSCHESSDPSITIIIPMHLSCAAFAASVSPR